MICDIHFSCSCLVSFSLSFLRVFFTSPITHAFTTTFLLISAGSTSNCNTFAFDANFLGLPNTLSENLEPIAINKSQSLTPKLDVLVPCIPSIPVYLSCLPSYAPLPIRVSHTGASTSSTNSFSSASASLITAPPPTKIYGFLDAVIISTALSIASSVIPAVILSGALASTGTYSVLLAVTSFVISTRTGPGRPVFAILKARLIVSASLSTSLTMKLCFVIGVVIPAISIS